MNFEKTFNPPIDALILQDIKRDVVGVDLINEYKKRFPGIDLIYAYISEEYESDIDYVLIFKGTQNIGGRNIPAVTIEAPLKFTSRCLNGYHYAKESGELDKFFSDVKDYSIILSSKAFVNILSSIGLSTDDSSEKFWKSEDNIDSLLVGIREMCTLYNRSVPKTDIKQE